MDQISKLHPAAQVTLIIVVAVMVGIFFWQLLKKSKNL